MVTASGTSFQTSVVQNLLELAWRFEPTTPRTWSEHSVGLPLCYPCICAKDITAKKITRVITISLQIAHFPF